LIERQRNPVDVNVRKKRKQIRLTLNLGNSSGKKIPVHTHKDFFPNKGNENKKEKIRNTLR